jgi:hypothetical protein
MTLDCRTSAKTTGIPLTVMPSMRWNLGLGRHRLRRSRAWESRDEVWKATQLVVMMMLNKTNIFSIIILK